MSDKKNALEAALQQINKQFGSGSIMKMDAEQVQNMETCSTGSLKLDKALGVGGLPYGRIVEIYGPESSGKTTLTLSTIAQAQKAGKKCAFIDTENALDIGYAAKLGVDVQDLIVSQPDTGEQALSIVEVLTNSGAVDVIVFDSVAAIVPKSEIEGEMGDSSIGVVARLMSQALRKLTPAVKKNNTLLIFINQIRMKIGVMFGCLHADNKISFEDGRLISIEDVVKKQIKGNVLSYNEQTHKTEYKPIIDWHYNGDVDSINDYLEINMHNYDSHKNHNVIVTKNHKIFVKQKGWIEAEKLEVGDKVISQYQSIINGEMLDFVKGLLVSGCSRLKFNEKYKVYDLKFNQNFLLGELSNNIISILKPLNLKQKHGKYISNLRNEYELKELYDTNSNPLRLFKKTIPEKALQIWLLTCAYRLNNKIALETYFKRERDLKELSKLFSRTGLENKVCNYIDVKKDISEYYVEFSEKATQKIIKLLGLDKIENLENDEYLYFNNHNEIKSLSFRKNIRLINSRVVSVVEKQHSDKLAKYDISIADNHNYFAGDEYHTVLVHNSPETTTGGNALKFYSSVRLDIRNKGKLTKNEDVYGNETKVKVVKNKVAPPFKEAEIEILYGKGFNIIGEILDLAVENDIIKKSGAWYSYEPVGQDSADSVKIGQGRDNAMTWLEENDEIRQTILNNLTQLNLDKK